MRLWIRLGLSKRRRKINGVCHVIETTTAIYLHFRATKDILHKDIRRVLMADSLKKISALSITNVNEEDVSLFFFFLPLFLSLFRAKYEKLLSTVRVLLFQVSLCAAGELPSDSLGFIVDTVMDGKRNAVDETLTVKFNQRNFLHRVFI